MDRSVFDLSISLYVDGGTGVSGLKRQDGEDGGVKDFPSSMDIICSPWMAP